MVNIVAYKLQFAQKNVCGIIVKMIETWSQPPPFENPLDIIGAILKLQSTQLSLSELPESATILDQNTLRKRVSSLQSNVAKLAINQEIIATRIQDYTHPENDMVWHTINSTTEANQRNTLGYVPGRYYWYLGDNGGFIRSRGRYRSGSIRPQFPDQATGQCVGVDFENSAIVIKPHKLSTRLWGSRQWIHLINPDGEPLVELNFPDLR